MEDFGDIKYAYSIYEQEEHGYAVENYTHKIYTSNKKLNKLWYKAHKSLKKLTEYFDELIEKGELEDEF